MQGTAISPACPKCGSTKIHHSHRRTLSERAASVLGAKMKRCHECNVRFVQLHGSTLLGADFQVVIRRMAWIALTILALFAVLAAVVWFSGRQAAPSDSSANYPAPASVNRDHPPRRA